MEEALVIYSSMYLEGITQSGYATSGMGLALSLSLSLSLNSTI